MINYCTKEQIPCIGKEKIIVNGKRTCCKEQIEFDFCIAQSVLDAIEDYNVMLDKCLLTVASRLSFAASVIDTSQEENYAAIMEEFKRFSMLAYEYKERIAEDEFARELTCSFIQVIKNWFSLSFMIDGNLYTLESIRSDLSTLEMALGACMLMPAFEEDLEDIFF